MRGLNRNSKLAWLLPLIVVRALVPVGFMPAWQEGSLTMVVCDSDGTGPAAHPGHLHHPAHDGPLPRHHGHGECPFAQSTGPALSPALAPLTFAYGLTLLTPAAVTSVAAPRIPPRYHAPRGPPTPV
jgi:hypothetical protein